MKWVTFRRTADEQADEIGVVDDERIVVRSGEEALLDLIRQGVDLVEEGAGVLSGSADRVGLADVRLRPPVVGPPTVRDFMTFEQHVESGYGNQGLEIPQQWFDFPVFYFTNPRALTGSGDPVPIPPGCSDFDFELEIGAIVGHDVEDVGPEEAESAIVGYCIYNDWSARDVQRNEMQVRLGPAKGKDSATTLGPWLVTPDELEPHRSGKAFDLQMVVSINGVELGRDSWASTSWSFGDMISYAARGTTVGAGDVLGSGTCGMGCIAEMRNRRGTDAIDWLRAGDTVRMEVEGIGAVENTVVRNPAWEPAAITAARPWDGSAS